MIVLYILFILIVLMISIYVGLQISTSINDPMLYVLFWIVYLIICMSLANGIAITYFWNILQTKTGPPGFRGPEGDIGNSGIKGKCLSTCSTKTCSINLRKVVEDELERLNKGVPVKLTNSMLLFKIDQMCNSKDYEIVAPMKGPNNVLSYMTEKWIIWINLIYNAAGIDFFTNESAEDDYNWPTGVNPFDEISKYDLWNWGLTRDFEPLAIEICNDPSKSNEFPKHNKQRFKYIYTNSYSWVVDDYKSKARLDVSIWKPNQAIFENERYYPVGYVAVGPARWGEYGSAPKFADSIRVTGKGPDKSTIVVTGDVKPPIDYIWKWNSAGSPMYWGGSMWTPVPPPGYVCLGDVMVMGWNKPPIGEAAPIRCVPAKFVQPIPNGGKVLIYNDKGSRAYADGSIFGMNNGAYGRGSPENGYNCFRCVIGYPGSMGNGSFPFYRILDEKLIINSASIKDINTRYTDKALGWHGSPQREPKYSIFSFLGLVPETIITSKISSRKYYMMHSGDYYHNDDNNTQIPINSYLVLQWNEDTNDFTHALTAIGTDSVILLPQTRIDIRQQWEVIFIEDSKTNFRLKSRDSNLYLYVKPKLNLRGRELFYQVKESALSDPEILEYTTFIDTKPAFGTPLNRMKSSNIVQVEGEEVRVPYIDISKVPMPTNYPDRFIKTMVAGEKDPPIPSSRLSSRLSKKSPGSSTAAKVVTGLVVGAVAGAVVGTVVSKSIGNNKKKTDEKKKKKKKK
jgi:hypothetical protein